MAESVGFSPEGGCAYGAEPTSPYGRFTGRNIREIITWYGGERRIRTYKSLRTPVFKTGAIAVLPALQSFAI